MKVAHLVIITPKRCGLYETTRELVTSLRKQGIDSRLVDPTEGRNPLMPTGDNDRGALFANKEWAKEADIFVNHSGLGELEEIDKPVIHVAHGRPRHSFLSERDGSTPIYSYHYHNNFKKNFKAVVTFWRQHTPYLKVMYPDKPVFTIQRPIDLNHWSPGATKYDFSGQGDFFNVVCTDAFRDDIDCYVPLNAYALAAREIKGMKLHIFGKPKNMKGWGALIKRIQDDGNMGLVQGWAQGLEHVYRASDLVLTAHEINVRTIGEAMGCGCPVVKFGTNISNCIEKIKSGLHVSRKETREKAEILFNPNNTATQFMKVLECAI